jgi:hypothetical protein
LPPYCPIWGLCCKFVNVKWNEKIGNKMHAYLKGLIPLNLGPGIAKILLPPLASSTMCPSRIKLLLLKEGRNIMDGYGSWWGFAAYLIWLIAIMLLSHLPTSSSRRQRKCRIMLLLLNVGKNN